MQPELDDFVRNGVFPKEISRKISRAQEVRHASDYDDFYIVSKEGTMEQIDTAEQVIDMIETYVNERCSV